MKTSIRNKTDEVTSICDLNDSKQMHLKTYTYTYLLKSVIVD